jgi:hypothetical protein
MSKSTARVAVVGLVAALAALAACGKGDDGGKTPAKGDDASAAPSDPGAMPTPEQMAKQAEDTRKALAEMSGGKDIKAVEPMELKALLPETLAGAKRSNAQASRMNQGGIEIATTRASYDPEATEGDTPKPSFSVEIMDLGNLSGAMSMGFTSWAMTQFENVTDTGYEKTTKYKDHPAVEKYDNESKSGELQVYVAKRFLVKVSGNDTTIEQIRAAVDTVDLGKIASLAK